MKIATALLALSLIVPSAAYAGRTCLPIGASIPKDYKPPAWATGMGTDVNSSLDDPRWNGSIADSGTFASATSAMHMRSMWKDGYLYLSFISDLNFSATPNAPRDIYVGLKRTQPAANGQLAYVFQFHLDNDTAHEAKVVPACDQWTTDDTFRCATPNRPNYVRVFANTGTSKTCKSVTMGDSYKQIASPTWLANNVHSWQQGTRWAVQMRLKLVDADPANPTKPTTTTPTLEQGIEWTPGGIWYEATQSFSGDDPISLLKLPSSAQSFSRCSEPPTSDHIVRTAGDANAWNQLTLSGRTTDPAPTDCDGGLTIDRGHFGVLDANGKIGIKILAGVANTIVAQVVNTTSAPVSAKLRAKFRIADWGATVPGAGTWIDVPATNGTVNPVVTPAPVAIPAGGQQELKFQWTLSEEEYCKYSIENVPGYSCIKGCTPCSDTVNGCSQVKRPNGTLGTCQPIKTGDHQCMQVEVSAPNSAVRFGQSSVFNNMDFRAMSKFSSDATIDVTGAPLVGNARDVILVMVPRNLPPPKKTKPTRTTGLEMLTNNSLAMARRIADSHQKSIRILETEQNRVELKKRGLGRTALTVKLADKDERFKDLGSADLVRFDAVRRKLPQAEFETTGALIDIAADAVQASKTASGTPAADLTRRLVHDVGPTVAAQVVPVIEIYPYYRPAQGSVYQPMQPFSVFLSHEGPLLGFKVSDLVGANGANVTKLAQNIFKLSVPKEQTRAKVTVSAETIDPPPSGPVPPAHDSGPQPTVVNPGTPVTPVKPIKLKPLKPNWKVKLQP